MALRTPEQDPNRIQNTYEEGLNPNERKQSESGVYAKRQDDPDERRRNLQNEEANGTRFGGAGSDVQAQEESRDQPWANKTTPQESLPRQRSIKGFLKANKKRGPIAGIIALLIGGAFGLSFLTPGFLLIHITETITDRFNMQNASMDARATRILTKRIGTSGFCAETVSIRCKFSSMNDRHKTRLEAAGFKVNTSGTTPVRGRHIVTSLEYNGKTITAANLSREIRTDPTIRGAFNAAYNPKFAGFWDKVGSDVRGRLGMSFTRPFDSSVRNDEDRNTKVRENINEDRSIGDRGSARYIINDDDTVTDTQTNQTAKNSDGSDMTPDQATALNSSIESSGDGLAVNSKSVADSGQKRATSALRELENRGGIRGAIGITGIADNLCSVYGATKAVALGAKTVRAVQLARYAGMFLTTASMIKSGDATPEDVSYFSTLLTKTVNREVTDEDGNTTTITTKAATDSYGYNYAAYGDAGPLSASATQFLAGGGLGGKLSGFVTKLTGLVGGKENADDTCRILRNPWVGAGSLAIGVASMLGPGWVVKGLSMLGEEVIVQAAVTLLPALLQDMVAGVVVDDSTFGEEAGDAIVSGSGVFMSTLAGVGGNAPLRPEQAVAYMGTQQEVIARNAEDERLAHSPLDPSSPHTFAGRIASQFIPYTSQANSISSFVTTSLSVAKRSLATIVTPSAFAAENTVETYTQCEDPDYRALGGESGLATDPFCNPIRGIPPKYLEKDPMEVLDYLITGGYIDEETGQPKTDTHAGKEYSAFIENCITRERPLGFAGEDSDDANDDGRNCFIEGDQEEKKACFYLNQIDMRVLDGMEEGYDISSGDSCVDGGGAQMSREELNNMISDYGMPAPDEAEARKLIEGLKSNKTASGAEGSGLWAAKSLLAGEKKWKAAGGEIKEYLTTAWIWYEISQDRGGGWPDPYFINCGDIPEFPVNVHCSAPLYQVAGYQSQDRRNDYVEFFKKMYSEEELPKVLEDVLTNSSKAYAERWDYGMGGGVIEQYRRFASSATLDDISPSKDFNDPKTQFLTTLLGKDPAMVAALNSVAVSDSDIGAMLRDCTSLSWSNNNYYCNPNLRPTMSNMMLALYLIDSEEGGTSCAAGAEAGSALAGWDITTDPSSLMDYRVGKEPEPLIKFKHAMLDNGATAFNVSQLHGPNNSKFALANKDGMYKNYDFPSYGFEAVGHPGYDIAMPLGTKLYAGVEGTVIIAGGSGYFYNTEGTKNTAGMGELKIQLSNGDEVILGHMQNIVVNVGDKVTAGTYVGESGYPGGPHLHLEYRKKDSGCSSGFCIVDPTHYIP